MDSDLLKNYGCKTPSLFTTLFVFMLLSVLKADVTRSASSTPDVESVRAVRFGELFARLQKHEARHHVLRHLWSIMYVLYSLTDAAGGPDGAAGEAAGGRSAPRPEEFISPPAGFAGFASQQHPFPRSQKGQSRPGPGGKAGNQLVEADRPAAVTAVAKAGRSGDDPDGAPHVSTATAALVAAAFAAAKLNTAAEVPEHLLVRDLLFCLQGTAPRRPSPPLTPPSNDSFVRSFG